MADTLAAMGQLVIAGLEAWRQYSSVHDRIADLVVHYEILAQKIDMLKQVRLKFSLYMQCVLTTLYLCVLTTLSLCSTRVP
jgi:hypothetical protein